MKHLYWLLIMAAVLLSCQPSNAGSKNKQKQGAQVFTLADAEKILGEKAHMNEGKTTNNDGIAVYQSAYVADAVDQATGKTRLWTTRPSTSSVWRSVYGVGSKTSSTSR